jgi:lipopolysaccharide transport system permease protein
VSTKPVQPFVVTPPGGAATLGLKELWEFRELVYFLAWRDVKVRYKHAVLGVAWVVLQPLSLVALFSFVFGRTGLVPTGGKVPFVILTLVALVPWQYFARVVSDSTSSLVTDQRLITRVYFPRLLVPTATAGAALVDFSVSMIIVAMMMVIFGVDPPSPWAILGLSIAFLVMLAAALGAGFWLSALNVEYRDVMHTVPFLMQVWFFATPVIYSSSNLPEKWWFVWGLNPMLVVTESFRACLLGVPINDWPALTLSAAVALVLLVTGAIWFRARERVLVDSLGSTGT